MEDNFNKHLGNKLKLRRLALGLTQTKVAKAINVTFQQIQKYEKGTNGVSSIRLLQLSNYLKVPINYFFEDFSDHCSHHVNDCVFYSTCKLVPRAGADHLRIRLVFFHH